MTMPLTRLLLIGAATALIAPPELAACNKRRATAPLRVDVLQLTPTSWIVHAPGYTTTPLDFGVHFCAIGVLPESGGAITSVESVALRTEANGSTLTSFAWQDSAAIAASFARVKSGAWRGYLGQVAGPSAGGADNMIVLHVTVKAGTKLADLESTLKKTTIAIDRATFGGDLLDIDRFLLVPATVVELTLEDGNARTFFNDALVGAAGTPVTPTRQSTADADTLYQMPPREFRYGQGDATGWVIGLQDGEAATAETIELGFVKYAGATLPDTSPSGLLTNVAFDVSGSGSGSQDMVWTLRTSLPVDGASFVGLRVVLPKPRSTQDTVRILTQPGATTKIPVVVRGSWTWLGTGAGAVPYGAAGTTLYLGGLFHCAVARSVTRSTAYGPTLDLRGPESVYPSSAQSAPGRDFSGFEIAATAFAGQWAIVMLSAQYIVPGINLGPHKLLLIDPQQFLLAGSPIQLDGNGGGATPVVPLPRGVRFAFQAGAYRIESGNVTEVALTDAATCDIQ